MKNNSGRLLLFAVILTGCFSIKYAAYGKYVDYLKDYTSVRSAPFYFSSNYLGEVSDNKQYEIGSFNGQNFNLDVDIKNNDNSYNFNGIGKDYYYYVTVGLYTDSNYTNKYTGAFTTLIKYGKNNEYAAAMARYADNDKGEATQIIIDNSNSSYNNEGNYKLLGRLDGLSLATASQGTPSMADTLNEGAQTVSIVIESSSFPETIYMKVDAYVVPPSTKGTCTISKIVKESIPESQRTFLFPDGYKNAYTQSTTAFPDVIDGYNSANAVKGIYYGHLTGKFKLTKTGSGGVTKITRNVNISGTDYAVLYTFSSNNNTDARLHYDSSKLTPDSSLGEIGTNVSPGYPKDDGSGEYCDKYVTVKLFANGSKACYFYKDTLSTPISASDVCAEVVE